MKTKQQLSPETCINCTSQPFDRSYISHIASWCWKIHEHLRQESPNCRYTPHQWSIWISGNSMKLHENAGIIQRSKCSYQSPFIKLNTCQLRQCYYCQFETSPPILAKLNELRPNALEKRRANGIDFFTDMNMMV